MLPPPVSVIWIVPVLVKVPLVTFKVAIKFVLVALSRRMLPLLVKPLATVNVAWFTLGPAVMFKSPELLKLLSMLFSRRVGRKADVLSFGTGRRPSAWLLS